MKHFTKTFSLIVLMSMVGTEAYAYDFSAKNADGITIYYNYINDGKELEVAKPSNSTTYSCDDLVIPEEVTFMGRTRKVTAIGGDALHYAYIKSVTIPKTITKIKRSAFYDVGAYYRSGIIVYIDDIEAWCRIEFDDQYSNPLYYAKNFFVNGEELKELIIPKGITAIGNYAFIGCPHLSSLQLSKDVKSIGTNAFYNVNLSKIVMLNETPFEISEKTSKPLTFSLNTYNNATLYVPQGALEKYKSTKGWKDFIYINEGTGENGIVGKCEKPTVNYENGKLTFNCSTDGVNYRYNIADADIKAGSGNDVQLTVTYNISVYATKSGYEDSETVKATLCWVDVNPKTEGIESAIANVRANPILIQSNGGVLNISGVNDGTEIVVYSVSGQMVGTSKAVNNQASVFTNIKKGEIAIVKIGDKSIKVVMQ